MRQLEERLATARRRLADLDTYIRISQEFGEASVDGGVTARAVAALSAIAADRKPSRPRAARASPDISKAERARALSVDFVRRAGRPVQTRELVDMLRGHGLAFGRGNPKLETADLSGILRRTSELTVRRGEGWSLAAANEMPASVETSIQAVGAVGDDTAASVAPRVPEPAD